MLDLDPPTLDSVVSLLRPAAKTWKGIGEALELSEDFLDELLAKKVPDEDCLDKVMHKWMNHQEPSMEKLITALRKVGEDVEAFLKFHKGMITKRYMII